MNQPIVRFTLDLVTLHDVTQPLGEQIKTT